MQRLSRLAAILFVLAFGLAACETQPVPQFRELTFSQLEPIRLAVDNVEVIDAYRSPLRDPNVEHRFPTAPAAAARRWAEDRLIATGGGARAVYTIIDASVIESPLEPTGGVKGIFTRDQSERYDAILQVKIDVFDDTGGSRATTTVTARESRTVREDATLNEREQVWFDMTEALMDALNGQLESNIDQFLDGYRT